MNAIEVDDSERYLTYADSSQVSFPDLELSEASQQITGVVDFEAEIEQSACHSEITESPAEKGERDEARDRSREREEFLNTAKTFIDISTTMVVATESTNRAGGVARTEIGEKPESILERNVDVLRMPKAKPRNTTRQKRKQSKVKTGDRLAIFEWPSIAVNLPELIAWSLSIVNLPLVREVFEAYPIVMNDPFLGAREPTYRRELVNPADYVYNFVVPLSLARTMRRVLDTQ